MIGTVYPHIELRGAVPYISGTEIKVVEIVLDRLAHNWDADEIRRQHPSLTLGRIHSALAYYYDHQAEMDRDIAERMRRGDEIIAQLGPSPARAKLVAAKQAQ